VTSRRAEIDLRRPLVYGFGLAGAAVVEALHRHGISGVMVADDGPAVGSSTAAELADAVGVLGASFVGSPRGDDVPTLVAQATSIFPSPGLPDDHLIFGVATKLDVPVYGEFDLVDIWDTRPLIVITGTDGKTTVTTMVTEMFRADGRVVVDAGNNELPLVTAINDLNTEVFVVEASSFRLGHTQHFSPAVGTWLNFAPDHLDKHASLARYEHAKAKLFGFLGTEGIAVANADDPIVREQARRAAEVWWFSINPDATDGFRIADGRLLTAEGAVLAEIADLPRSLPHDLSNALAAAATALAAGASIEAVRSVLRTFAGLPHRMQLVAEHNGIRWYNDSKATTPHATLAALAGFASAVLIAGGDSKGLDLSVLGSAAPHLRGVVAIGRAAPEVADAFPTGPEVRLAGSISEAVAIAAGLARHGDAVLLSPACASFDMFDNYGHRGRMFTTAVLDLLGPDHQLLEVAPT